MFTFIQCGPYNIFKTILNYFFAHENFKKQASNVAHNRPKPFFSQSSPVQSQKSKIDFSYHIYVPRHFCLLIWGKKVSKSEVAGVVSCILLTWHEIKSYNLGHFVEENLTLRKLIFCYQNCSDLLWEKNVLVIEKNFWNSMLKAKNFQIFWDHLNNLFKQWMVRTISGNRMLSNLFLEVSEKSKDRIITIQIEKRKCNIQAQTFFLSYVKLKNQQNCTKDLKDFISS